MKNNKRDDRRTYLRQSGLLATIPFLLVVPPIAGLFIGRFLDSRFNTDPILTIVLLILGFVAGAKETANAVRKANNPPGGEDDGKRE